MISHSVNWNGRMGHRRQLVSVLSCWMACHSLTNSHILRMLSFKHIKQKWLKRNLDHPQALRATQQSEDLTYELHVGPLHDPSNLREWQYEIATRSIHGYHQHPSHHAISLAWGVSIMLSFLLYQMHIMIFFAITDQAQHRYTYFIWYEKVHGGGISYALLYDYYGLHYLNPVVIISTLRYNLLNNQFNPIMTDRTCSTNCDFHVSSHQQQSKNMPIIDHCIMHRASHRRS